MSDLISRQAAVDALKGLPTWWADEGGYYGGAQPPMVALLDPEDAVSAIENLPPAEPKTGKWIHDGYDFPHGNDWIHCSVCGKRGINVPADLTNFCSNCGSKMAREDGEPDD